jgi:hypothetical protein
MGVTPKRGSNEDGPKLSSTEKENTLKRRNIVITTLASLSLLCAMAVAQDAQAPYVSIDPSRHGNLASAQNYILQAYNRIGDAQHDNHGQLGGHAARAKDLLSQANDELRLAADEANERQDERQYQSGPPLYTSPQ